jgi:hypothetical protein
MDGRDMCGRAGIRRPMLGDAGCLRATQHSAEGEAAGASTGTSGLTILVLHPSTRSDV